MKLLITTSFFVTASLILSACADEPAFDDADVPLIIDDDLLRDTFAECEIDIDTCLAIDEVADEIDRRIDDGEWAWSDPAEEISAAGFRYVRTGCIPANLRYNVARRECQRFRGTLLGAPRRTSQCTTRTARYQAPCRTRP